MWALSTDKFWKKLVTQLQSSLLDFWKKDNMNVMFKERIPHGDVESLVEILEITLWNGVWQQGFEMTQIPPERKNSRRKTWDIAQYVKNSNN